MASLFKASGLYYLDFYDRGRRPKRKRVALKVRDKRTADQLRIKYEGDYAQGLFDPWGPPPEVRPEAEPDLTLSVGVSRFLQAKLDADKTQNTIRSYRAVLSLLTDRVATGLPLADLGPVHLRPFIRDETVSATTNRNRHRHVRAAVRWWLSQDLLEADPLKGVNPPPKPARVPKAMTKEDLAAICIAIQEAYDERRAKNHARSGEMVWRVPLFRFAFYTGMRSSELARLRWGHLDWSRRLIIITRQKNRKAQTIPLNKAAALVLADVPKGEAEDYVFKSPGFTGRSRSTDRFVEASARAFKEARVRAGIERKITVHSARHGFCTHLAEAGLPAYVIKEAARHSEISTTMLYVSLSNEKLKAELDAVFR